MDWLELDARITALRDIVESTEEREPQWKGVWNEIKELNGAFRDARYPTRDERTAAWDRFQEAVGRVKKTEERCRERSTEHARRVAVTIDALKDACDAARDHERPWKDVWLLVNRTNDLFRKGPFPSHAAREEAWRAFRRLVDDATSAEAEQRSARADRSRDHRYEILRHAGADDLDFSGSDLIGGIIQSFAEAAVGGGGDGVRGELERRSSMLHEARTMFSDRKSEMFGGDKQEVFDALKKVERALADAWAEWRNQRAEERRLKHEAWMLRTEERIEKNETQLQDLYRRIARSEQHLAELEQKRDTAWNDDFRERSQGWIDEEQERISGLRARIEQVEGWIEADCERVRSAG